MNKVKSNIRKNFTICPNALINDNSISRDARFLFVWMSSKPHDWKFYQSAIADAMGCTEKTARVYLRELEEKGWITSELIRDEGRFASYNYTLNSYPFEQKLPTVKTTDGKNYRLTKKDFKQINTIERERTEKSVVDYLLKTFGNDFEIRPTGKYRKYIKQLIDEGKTIDQFKTVINRREKDYRAGAIQQYLVEPDVLFKPDLFTKELNAAKAKKVTKSRSQNNGAKVTTDSKKWDDVNSL